MVVVHDQNVVAGQYKHDVFKMSSSWDVIKRKTLRSQKDAKGECACDPRRKVFFAEGCTNKYTDSRFESRPTSTGCAWQWYTIAVFLLGDINLIFLRMSRSWDVIKRKIVCPQKNAKGECL